MIKILVVCKHSEGSEEAEICKIINMKNVRVFYSWKNTLSKNELKGVDLVISIGGDGTALSASHYLVDNLFLAVNSSPKQSEGILTTISIENLEDKLKKIVKRDYEIEKLERIEVMLNGKLLSPLVLNDVFIGSNKPYLVSKYDLIFKNNRELQRSSGLIFSTGTGSTAWFKSAGGVPFLSQAKYIKMIVREPYQGKLNKMKFLKEKIRENEKISVIPYVPSVLAIDSIREFKLNPNDKVEIKISNNPLYRIK